MSRQGSTISQYGSQSGADEPNPFDNVPAAEPEFAPVGCAVTGGVGLGLLTSRHTTLLTAGSRPF